MPQNIIQPPPNCLQSRLKVKFLGIQHLGPSSRKCLSSEKTTRVQSNLFVIHCVASVNLIALCFLFNTMDFGIFLYLSPIPCNIRCTVRELISSCNYFIILGAETFILLSKSFAEHLLVAKTLLFLSFCTCFALCRF